MDIIRKDKNLNYIKKYRNKVKEFQNASNNNTVDENSKKNEDI